MSALYSLPKQRVQTALRAIFPPSCIGCGNPVMEEDSLCVQCWRDLPIITGPVCNACGVPVLAEIGDHDALCQTCTDTPRPWCKGRSALIYKDLARTLILGLKHSDRHDVAPVAALWLAQAAQPLLLEDPILVPVPLHWSRLVRRRYNQSAVLAQHLALKVSARTSLDLLQRTVRTAPMDGVGLQDRAARVEGAIRVHPKRADLVRGAKVLLIDDVMTSGATLSACTQACLDGGAAQVDVLALARVSKDD